MGKNNLAVFKVDGVEYPITMEVHNEVQDYLYDKENVNWVNIESPYIKYQIKLDNKENKNIKRQVNSILSESDIGHYVINKLDLSPIN